MSFQAEDPDPGGGRGAIRGTAGECKGGGGDRGTPPTASPGTEHGSLVLTYLTYFHVVTWHSVKCN